MTPDNMTSNSAAPGSQYSLSSPRVRLTVCFLIPACLAAEVTALGGDRPNVILIIADDQSYFDFGFMGNGQVQTPRLDELAADSARYINGYVPSSVCRPSLVTLLTGQFPHEHGVHFNHPPPGFAKMTRDPSVTKERFDEFRRRATSLIRNSPSLPRILARHGYRCLQTGKYWEGHWRNAGFTEGMTVAQPSPHAKNGNKALASGDIVAHGNGDHGLVIGRETMEPIYAFIRDCGETPYFVWYAPFLPHLPHDSPRRFRDLYADTPDIPPHRVPYYAAISQFDETVGQLMDFVKQQGQLSRTLFVFVSDNGFVPDAAKPRRNNSEFDYTKKSKRAPFDDGLRTPILIRRDGHTRSATHGSLCSSVDIVPTILHAAGIPRSRHPFSGRTLWPSACGKKPLPDQPVFGEVYPGDASSLGSPSRDIAYRWVRDGRFKLILPHSRDGKIPWGGYLTQPALFDIAADPRETENLADETQYQPEILRLTELLNNWWTPDKMPSARPTGI